MDKQIEEYLLNTPICDWLERLDELLQLKDDLTDRKKVSHLLAMIGSTG